MAITVANTTPKTNPSASSFNVPMILCFLIFFFIVTACPPLYRLSGLSLKQTHSHKFGKSSYCIRYLFWCPINVPGIIYVTCAVTILLCFYDHLHHLSNMYVLRFVLVDKTTAISYNENTAFLM